MPNDAGFRPGQVYLDENQALLLGLLRTGDIDYSIACARHSTGAKPVFSDKECLCLAFNQDAPGNLAQVIGDSDALDGVVECLR